jgi:hypothetical protein
VEAQDWFDKLDGVGGLYEASEEDKAAIFMAALVAIQAKLDAALAEAAKRPK